jgi:hypothetical protein
LRRVQAVQIVQTVEPPGDRFQQLAFEQLGSEPSKRTVVCFDLRFSVLAEPVEAFLVFFSRIDYQLPFVLRLSKHDRIFSHDQRLRR